MKVKELIAHFNKHYHPDDELAYIAWDREDIISRAKQHGMKIDNSKAEQILREIDLSYHAEFGLTWDAIDSYFKTSKEGPR